MTFEELQQLCNQVVSTNQPTSVPCPIVVGDASDPIQLQLGDTVSHQLVIYRMKPDNAALHAIYDAVRFSFDAPNNQTVIAPITHEAG
jgi:hypothetical protein